MDRLTISMPEKMNEWVQSQINDGRYGNASEYFRDLVRRDQEKREAAIQELRTIIEEAEASGISDQSFDEIIAEAREKAIKMGATE